MLVPFLFFALFLSSSLDHPVSSLSTLADVPIRIMDESIRCLESTTLTRFVSLSYDAFSSSRNDETFKFSRFSLLTFLNFFLLFLRYLIKLSGEFYIFTNYTVIKIIGFSLFFSEFVFEHLIVQLSKAE